MFFFLSLLFICFIFYFFKTKILLFYQYFFEILRKQQLSGILLNIYVFNLINFTALCSLLATFFNIQETYQRCLNVVARVIWRLDVGQCQINVETTLCMSTSRFTTSIYNRQRRNNVVIFNVKFHNVDQRQNNAVNITIFKNLKRAKKYFWASMLLIVIN